MQIPELIIIIIIVVLMRIRETRTKPTSFLGQVCRQFSNENQSLIRHIISNFDKFQMNNFWCWLEATIVKSLVGVLEIFLLIKMFHTL